MRHWQKTDQGTLFEKRLFFVIFVKLLTNGTGQMIGRGNHYTTKKVLYIAIGIVSVWPISSVFIPINYYFLRARFILSPSKKIWNKNILRYWLHHWALLFNIISLLRYFVIVRNIGTPFQKLSALYWKYYYYGLIYLTNFLLIIYYLYFHVCIYFQYKK